MAHGFFISVEGSEGVGKSTFCRALEQHLQNKGLSVYSCREPGGSEVGKKVREIFLDPPGGQPLTATTELMLILAARAQHVATELRPRLQRGQVIICDRYLDSTLLYQGVVGKIPMNLIQDGHQIATDGLMPDRTFLLDCPEELARSRVLERLQGEGVAESSANRFDQASLATYKVYRAGFQSIQAMYPSRICLLDSSQPPAQLISEANQHLAADELV